MQETKEQRTCIKSLLLCFSVSLLLLFSLSCLLQKEQNGRVLRLGYMPNVTHATALVGIEKNIFQEEVGNSVKFKPIHFVVGNNIIDAFITNQIDAAYIGPGPFVNAVYRNVPIKLLSNACNGGTVIVETHGYASLRPGMRIAVPQYGNTQDLILRSYLEKKDLLNKVQIIALPPQDTGTAFFIMSIDGACLPEPWGTILIDRGFCNLIVDEKNILNNGDYPVTLLVVSKNYARNNPEIVSALLKAHKKANDFIVRNHEEVVNLTTQAIANLSKKQIDKGIILKSMKRCVFTNRINLNVLEDFKLVGIKAGYYREGFSLIE